MKRSKFDHTHVNSTTCKMGYAVPVMLSECLPGDTWQGDTQFFIRVAPMVAPLMHRVYITCATFFVPWRLVLPDFADKFITGGRNGDDDTVLPWLSIKPEVGTLADYFGLPLTENPIDISAAPFRAYGLIWNNYYRDQDLQDELPVSTDPGEDTTTNTTLQRANWSKDYFTTARPEPQKGPAMTIPVNLTAGGDPLITATTTLSGGGFSGTGSSHRMSTYDNLRLTGNANSLSLNFTGTDLSPANSTISFSNPTATTTVAWNGGPDTEGSLFVDDVLEAMALQKMATRRSLFGSRYEDLLHYWGLKTQDFRLQMPELVSVGRGQLQFSEVLQTSPDSSGDGVGAMSGHGVGAMRSGRFRYYCHEHGFLMTIMTVRPQAVYTQGIERMWTRKTRWDFWNPEMQHIGQQEVLSKEVFADGTEADEEVFGYQNRFDEYRRGKNHVSGEFRTTLDYWNMARIFENRPSLNSEFITCDPTDRIFQLSESLSDQLYCMVNNKLVVKRLMSKNGNPM